MPTTTPGATENGGPDGGLSTLLGRVRAALPPGGAPLYLVGGALRDVLLQRPLHDLDFALPGDGLSMGRRLADRLGGAYYPLDTERGTARVILSEPDGSRLVLDFAALRGPDLDADLRLRDFTINAIAVGLDEPERLIDPLGGAADLRQKRLRACSPEAMLADPARILRGVRQALDFGLQIEPATRQAMRQAAPELKRVSPERLRDELFRILEGGSPAAGLRILDALGALPAVLPELAAAHGVEQSAPHTQDVWNHTLAVMDNLSKVLAVLDAQPDPDRSANWTLGYLSGKLGRFRGALAAHLAERLNPNRALRGVLLLAAAYHDSAKPRTRSVESGGRVRFFEHDVLGAQLAARRARLLHLSNPEIERVETIVRQHMRPLLLGQGDTLPSPRAIFRFFRDCGAAGVDICLLSLADVLGTYGPGLPREVWIHHLDVVRALLEAWWERPAEQVAPPALLSGHDLMGELNLPPGRQIGRLLLAIQEAQVECRVRSRAEALALARGMLQEGPPDPGDDAPLL